MAINLSALAGAGAQFFDDNGDPLAGGLLYSFASGTTTPIVTYTTQLGTVNNTNPIVLDAGGRTPYEIWVNGGVLYKFRLTTSAGVLIGDYDNIPAIDDPTVFNNLITVTGTDTLIGTSVPPITGYVTGATYSFIPINTNTGAVTIDLDGFGAKEILFDSSTSLSAGALQTGKFAVIEYDGTRFQLVNSFVSSQIPDGSITVAKLAADTRSDVASATTISLSALSPATRNIRITGSTGPIGAFTVASGFDYFVVFSGTPTITNSASIVTNTGADIIVKAGDSCIIRSTAANTVEILNYTRFYPSVQLQPISASVAASALTISASTLTLDFRSTTLGSGTVTTITGTPANLVISSGSTLGTISAVQSDIAVLAINNAGTIELACINMAGGNDLTETGLISTTAEGGAGAADSNNVFYSTTARTNVAYRVIGIIRSTQATAGTWATAPSTIQGAGGNALNPRNGSVLLAAGSVSSQAALAIVLTTYQTAYRKFKITIDGARPATNAVTFQMRTSNDGGSTYTSSAGAYDYVTKGASTAAASQDSNSASATTINLTLANVIGNGTTESLDCVIDLYSMNSSAKYSDIYFHSSYLDQSANGAFVDGVGHRLAAEVNNAVQFFFSSGNITELYWTLEGSN